MTTAQINYAIPNADGSQRYAYDNSFQPLPTGGDATQEWRVTTVYR